MNDLIPGGNVTIITDVALKNPTEEDVEFPPTATVMIGINEITKESMVILMKVRKNMLLVQRLDRQNKKK